MKISYYLDEKSKVVLEVYEGDLILEKLIESWETFWQHPKFNPKYDLLMDARPISTGLNFDETLRLSNLMNGIEAGIRSKVAVLVSDPKIAVQADLYGEITKGKQAVQIFTSPEKAVRWVGASPDILERGYECLMKAEY